MTSRPVRWIKAARSHATSACLEVAADGAAVLLRNSMVPESVTTHSAAEFAVFVEAVKNGEFDHLL